MKTAWVLPSDNHPYSRPAFGCCGISGKPPKAFKSQFLHFCIMIGYYKNMVLSHKEDTNIKILCWSFPAFLKPKISFR